MLNPYSSEQGPSLRSTSWPGSTTESNDGLALIARSFFDIFQNPSNDSTPTNNEAPPARGDARDASVADETEGTKSTSLSSIAATPTTQEEPKSSAATLSTVDVARPSSDQPKGAEENGWRYWDWVRPRTVGKPSAF